MFYEMQFKSGKNVYLAENNFSSNSILFLEKIREAAIIFDDNQNCLFFNAAAEQILGDLTDISLIGDWIRSKAQEVIEKERLFKVRELPWKILEIDDYQFEKLEILLSRLELSDDIWRELSQQRSLSIYDSLSTKKQLNPASILDLSMATALSHDRLTGLPNYNLLLEKIDKSINLAQQKENYEFVILFVDINRFKIINSSLGRILGDCLLVAISKRLQNCLRSYDFISRMGNDEFAILLDDVGHLNYATDVAERIQSELTVPFNLGGYEVFIEASIGIAPGTKDYAQPENLLRDAELAVSDAKRQSKCQYQIFNKSMRGKALTLLQLENDLRRAIKREEFFLHYQPIISLETNNIKGFEVLVRWRHPLKGIISPGEFIPLAEDTGLIIPLGSWVLREACKQMCRWQIMFDGLPDWKVSVNISSKQLALPNFVEQVKQVLRETNLNPHNLKLEITESSLVEDTQYTIAILSELKTIGIEFSLDDFGTGYSSLSYLHQFPFDTIKIDRSFVSSIGENTEKLGIIRAIVTLARNLGMNTIAEGIETVNQLAQLKALKCQYGQGYYLSKPLDKEILESILSLQKLLVLN